MNARQTISKPCRMPALLALMLPLVAGSAAAATYNLVAMPFFKAMPGGASVTMWGYALDGTSCTAPPCLPSVPGPALVVPPGDTSLTVNLRNTLPVTTSIVIPGQALPTNLGGTTLPPVKFTDSTGRQRVRAFTLQAGSGSSQSYTWHNLKTGTYLYHSGTQPQVQVQMGLYGAVTHDALEGQAYAGVAYDSEVTLLFSEVDPTLHLAVAAGLYGPGLAMSSTIDYAPKYFLINGEAHPDPSLNLSVGNAGQTTLVRLLNAGLQSRSPVLQGLYMRLMAEDGNPYPHAREQYSAFLPALKTADVLITPAEAATYPLYDRRLAMSNPGAAGSTAGGMLAFLTVGGGTPPVLLYFSTAGNTAIPGVAPAPTFPAYDNADIYSWDGTSFARVFDATEAGLPFDANVDGLKVMGSQIYLSFQNDVGVSVPGIGVVQDEDIVVYDTGSGSWSLFFDGSAVDLTLVTEDVDAFDILADGSVLISTWGAVSVPGLTGTWDEDVLRCVPGSSSPIASCTWSVYFDGSDVGLTLADEDVNGFAVASSKLYLSIFGPYSMAGGFSGTGGDVFSCDSPVTGAVSSCGGFSLYFRASDHGLGDNLDAVSVP